MAAVAFGTVAVGTAAVAPPASAAEVVTAIAAKSRLSRESRRNVASGGWRSGGMPTHTIARPGEQSGNILLHFVRNVAELAVRSGGFSVTGGP